MTEEEKNIELRRLKPLTKSEKLGFFFLPFNFGSRLFPTKEFNNTEIERYKKFGFEKKLVEANKIKIYGFVFYTILLIIFILSTS